MQYVTEISGEHYDVLKGLHYKKLALLEMKHLKFSKKILYMARQMELEQEKYIKENIYKDDFKQWSLDNDKMLTITY